MAISCSFQLLWLFYLNYAQLLDQTNYSGPGVIGEGDAHQKRRTIIEVWLRLFLTLTIEKAIGNLKNCIINASLS